MKIFLYLTLFLAIPCAHAQISTGTLTGIISDPSQAKLPGVTVELTNEETGVTTTNASNPQGEFTFPLLPPGTYRLSAKAAGFRPYTHSGIVLESGRVTRLDFKLELGAVNETIEVSGSAPLLESESSTVGQFIEHKTIIDMPLNGRRVGDILALMGNSLYIQGNVTRPRMMIAGGRSDQQQWLLDGVNASNIALEVSQALFNPPVESVQEIRVQQNAYSAEYGNSTSGVIAITSKSGTNEYHGSAYEFFRNDALDARNFFAADKAPLRWNIFGFAVGGPVRKNRTFFFTSVEWQKQRVGTTRLLSVPTALQRAGDFSQTLTAAGARVLIYDPATTRPDPANPSRMIRDVFSGNIVPANRLDPVGQKFAALYPLPNRAAANLAGASNFVRNALNIQNTTTWTTKIDHLVSEKDRISGRFLMNDFPQENTPTFDEPAADPNGNRAERRAYSLLLNEIHNFTPTLINDFRFNWQPRRNHNMSFGLNQGWPEKLGLKGVPNAAFPRVTVAGFTAMGPATQERIQMPIHDTHLVDNMSWFRGGHSVKFGGELRLARNVDIFDQQISGQFGFNVQPTALPGVNNTGNALASLLLGFPNSGQILYTDLLDRRAKYVAFFVQDDWKVTSNLTLNIGGRWEAHTPRVDASNRQNGFDPYAINPVSKTPGVVTFAGLNGMGSQVYNGDYNNIGPRIGLAWKPFGGLKTVVRSGYGIFFGPPLPGSNTAAAGFQTSGSFTTPDNGITAPFYLRDGLPATAARQQLGPDFGAVAPGAAARFAPEFIPVDHPLSYSQQWNFGIQHELGWHTMADISYVASVGHKLDGPDQNINQVRPELMGPGNAQSRRPFPQFANVVMISPMWGNSSYHSLNIKLEKRFSNGLNFLANYTYSKFIDDVPSNQEVGSVSGAMQSYYNRHAEKSLSGNDIRNRFVWSSVYEVPFGTGRRWLSKGISSKLLGGWNLGMVAVLQQGAPVEMTVQNNSANAFSGAQRVNVLRDPSLPVGERTLTRWFDTSAVAAPAPYTFGNAGRALVTGPGLANINVSLLKNHRLKERYNLQVRLEAFNVINRANFEDPGGSLGSSNFGVISAAKDARIVQLGMKLEF
ncbi:MAG: carboxypeptidase regulatory-like domain-containing protein [Acidobacteria bacterium]|nr:carboxypeptidase regulatory-like domain-containing protein [Acidobacteriota bacterium]